MKQSLAIVVHSSPRQIALTSPSWLARKGVGDVPMPWHGLVSKIKSALLLTRHQRAPASPRLAPTGQRFKSEFLRTLEERGFLKDCNDWQTLDGLLARESVSAYIGFDATANGLHVGNLTQLMLLRWLKKTGHRPIVLVGGGTTRIGDPSGKNGQRRMLETKEIANNGKIIEKCFNRLLEKSRGTHAPLFVDNAAWLNDISWLDFLSDYGKHFSVNRMVKVESVRRRLDADQPLSFLEFNYMVLQAYDFLQLHRRENCRLQLGGSDQWGNILCGIELIRRVERAESFVLTTPLLTTATGEKMGKTATGAVWLNREKLSSHDFWQFWRNSADADVGRFLRLFTELPMEEIRRLELLQGKELNEAKILLATEITTLCHGSKAAQDEEQRAKKLFADGDLSKATERVVAFEDNRFVYEVLREVGLVASNSAARRLIRQGGVRQDSKVVRDEQARLFLKPQEKTVLSVGKKAHCALVGKAA